MNEPTEEEKEYWRTVFSDVQKPINPQVGYDILKERCGFKFEKQTRWTKIKGWIKWLLSREPQTDEDEY